MKIKEIKNFFDSDDLELICSLRLYKKVNDETSAIYHNKISKNFEVTSELINSETLKAFHKKYHPIAIKILEDLFPEKVQLYEYS